MRHGWLWAGAALAALGACDEVDFDDELTYAEMVDANAAMAERVSGLANATKAELPTTGSGVFDGYATLVMGEEGETSLVGAAALTADYGDQTIAGTLEDFAGRVDGGPIERLEGEITLSDGDLGLGSPSGFGVDMEGELTGERHVVGVEGALAGHILSSRDEDASAVRAVSAGGSDFFLDGEEVGGGLVTVVAER